MSQAFIDSTAGVGHHAGHDTLVKLGGCTGKEFPSPEAALPDAVEPAPSSCPAEALSTYTGAAEIWFCVSGSKQLESVTGVTMNKQSGECRWVGSTTITPSGGAPITVSLQVSLDTAATPPAWKPVVFTPNIGFALDDRTSGADPTGSYTGTDPGTACGGGQLMNYASSMTVS